MKQFIYIFLMAFLFISCEANENEESLKEDSKNGHLEAGNDTNSDSNKDIASNDNENAVKGEEEKVEFEGVIKYDIIIEPKSKDFNTNQVKKTFGNTMDMYISNGRYKIDYTNAQIDKIIYLKEDNKQYIINSSIDTVFVIDCRSENTNLYSKLKKDVDYKILDREVKYIGLFTNKFKQHSYYDPSLYVNPEHFKDHNYGNVDVYYKLAESPYIYSEIEYDNFKVIMKPKEIIKRKLDDSEFKIPDLPKEEKQFR